ncbi:putative invertase inhibitor [Curcuma longa]|uniref:putative invertase inhibitor n=1 Tax=Curcuma longa TaxID=136217 RepID=UPI003D9F71D5
MMMRQAPVFALAALLLLLSPAAHATVESTCKSISDSDHPGVQYDFCVKTLQSDPSSATADVRGLAVIATKLSSKKATEISGKIKELLKSSQDKAEKESLSTCDELYSNLIDNLDSSLSAITLQEK